ncbi:Growth arrest-specific protein 7 [Sciurus carolinensis]|uniref:Growth arrest-specific protein 7 n=1 Tax=Sciurus carolinensis TaxID=30640 RepID=A0AA41TAS5_SCICA|nr:Growth arrest-specific protein 7 [Sciurus carolinensis]
MNFQENFKKYMKKCDHHISDLHKQLASHYALVEKAQKALTKQQRDLQMKTKQLEIKLSNKMEEDIKKSWKKSTQACDDLMCYVDLYNQAQSKWFEKMVTTTLELEIWKWRGWRFYLRLQPEEQPENTMASQIPWQSETILFLAASSPHSRQAPAQL